jgi:hypothetical protein
MWLTGFELFVQSSFLISQFQRISKCKTTYELSDLGCPTARRLGEDIVYGEMTV